MIRVLHFIPGFDFGGIETVFKNNFKAIDKNNIEMSVIVEKELASPKAIKELEEMGCQVFAISRLKSKNLVLYSNELKQVLKNKGPFDIVHSYNITRTPILFSIAKKLNINIRIYHARTDRASDHKGKRVLFRQFINIGARQASDLLACSYEAGKFFFKDKEFRVLNNGIETTKYLYDSEKRKKIQDQLNIDNSNFVIGHVGRFTDAKNHFFLIDIFNELARFNPKATLLLVGDGPLKDEIKEKIKYLNLTNRVIFTGSVNNVEDYYQVMDVFLFPSLYEGFGNVVIEAQASGLKVLASDRIPKSTQISSLVEFLSISADSPEVWAQVLEKKRNYSRNNMLEVVKGSGYDINRNAKIQEKIYFELAANKGIK